MRYTLMTVFLFGAALFGAATTASAHPGHGGGPGHFHSHNHGSVIIYRSNFVSPYYFNNYSNFYYQQPVILHRRHLHGHNGLHNHGGLFIRTGGIRFGIHH